MTPERILHLMTVRMEQVHGLTPDHILDVSEDHFFRYFKSPERDEDGGPCRMVCIGIDEGDSYLATEVKGGIGTCEPNESSLENCVDRAVEFLKGERGLIEWSEYSTLDPNIVKE